MGGNLPVQNKLKKMNSLDEKYKDMLRHIMKNGVVKKDRTGTGTISVFDYTIRHKMSEGFPLLTSKKMYWKGIVHELLWFLRGDTNIKYLVDNGCHIWDGDCYSNYQKKAYQAEYNKISNNGMFEVDLDWQPLSKEEFIVRIKTDGEFAKKWGELGSIYGKQWRKWEYIDKGNFINLNNINDPELRGRGLFFKPDEIDQIANLIRDLKANPDSRRLMVSAWNPGEIDEAVLPPCHYGFQCYTYGMSFEERISEWCSSLGKSHHYGEDMTSDKLDELGFPVRKLSLKWTQRSTDSGLGLPFNFASYGLLLMMLANETNMIPDELIFSGGDCHIYLNQFDGIRKNLEQESYPLPKVVLNKERNIFDMVYEDIVLSDYRSSPKVEMPLSN
jgi:thymidylate synthase